MLQSRFLPNVGEREEVSSHFSGQTNGLCWRWRGGGKAGIIAVRRGFLKRNNSWRSCRNKTLHNGCHKLKLKKNTSFFSRQNRSHFRNPERNYYFFFRKILSYLFENLLDFQRISLHMYFARLLLKFVYGV